MKRLMAVALTTGMLVAAAAPAAQAFHGIKRHAEKSIALKLQRKEKGYGSLYHQKYGVTFERGFPYSCREYGKRARLTGNGYWQYAYDRCRFSYYSHH